VTGGKTYAISGYTTTSKTVQHVYHWYDKADGTSSIGKMAEWQANGPVAVAPANAKYLRVVYRYSDDSAPTFEDMRCQVELGSTAHPYVPYGHVGLDVTADGTTTTTPIPLPSRGWVGSLPDGTHDALSIDGAGKVTWELADGRLYTDGSTLESQSIGTNFTDIPLSNIGADNAFVNPDASFSRSKQMSNLGAVTNPDAVPSEGSWANGVYRVGTNGLLRLPGTSQGFYKTSDELKSWLAEHPLEMYYPLATPTTEDMGYIDLPDIPDGAVVSMPELEGLGVESWTGDAVARYVRAWAARS
jgi:hypothetical protein